MQILIVDDHPIFRQGLSALLRQSDQAITIFEAQNAAAAYVLVRRQAELDVVILDLKLPDASGLDALREVARLRPDLPVIVLSSSEDIHDAQSAFANGACGYVSKSASQHDLRTAITTVLEGGIYQPPGLVGALTPPSSTSKPDRLKLTERQVQILSLLSQGVPNKLIAHQLSLSENTVKVHVTAIFKALNVINRTQAAAVGRSYGLI